MKDNGLLVQYFTANTTDSQDLWKKAAEDGGYGCMVSACYKGSTGQRRYGVCSVRSV